MSFRRRALFLAGLFVAVSCSDAGNPLSPEGPKQPEPEPSSSGIFMALTCIVDDVAGTFTCEPQNAQTGDALGAINIGGGAGGGTYFTVNRTNIVSTADSSIFDASITNVMNRQIMGTLDGVTADPKGMRFFFFDPLNPTIPQPRVISKINPADSAWVEVVTPDTMVFSSGTGKRPYFQHLPEIVEPGETSMPRTWKFAKHNVAQFSLSVYVYTEVRWPKGWLEIVPEAPVVQAGGTETLTAQVRNNVGRPLRENLAWSSSNPAIVTVLENAIDSTAVITGVADGTAWVRASSVADPVNRRDSVLVVVAPQDSMFAITNVTVQLPADSLAANVPGGTLVKDTTYTTTEGGTATIDADGTLSYLSEAGFDGRDVISYDVIYQGVRVKRTLAVIVDPSNYWYAQASGDEPDADNTGRDADPFPSLVDALAAAGQGDTVFILPPKNGTDALTGHAQLENGEALVGAAVSDTFDVTLNGARAIIFAGYRAQPGLTRASGATVTLAQNNVLVGLAIDNDGGTAIQGSGFGTLRVRQVSVEPTGPALDLNTGTLDAEFMTLSAQNSTTSGLILAGVSGKLDAPLGALSLAPGASGRAVLVNGSSARINLGASISGPRGIEITGVTADSVTLSGTLSLTGEGINVHDNTGGVILFTGTGKSLTTGANPGVLLTNNAAGSTVRFAGGNLHVTTTSGAGFSASGAGELTLTGGLNTVATGSGVSVSITSVNTGDAGVSFDSVSAGAGAANGIVLNGISGTGFQATGGSIAGTTGAAVLLTNTSGADSVSLRGMALGRTGAGAAVISGTTFGKLHLLSTTVTGSGGAGALSLNGGTLSGSAQLNGSNATVTPLSLTNVDGSLTANGGLSVAVGGTGAVVDVNGGTVSLTYTGSVQGVAATPMVHVRNHQTGTLAFNGTNSMTGGSPGLRFENADGTYNLNVTAGTTALSGDSAGIDILAGTDAVNGSQGTFQFGAPGNGFAITSGAGTAFNFQGSAADVTFHGGITKNGTQTGRMVDISGQRSASAITFQTGTLSATSSNAASTGILLNDADGAVSFNGTTTLGSLAVTTGDAGIDVENGSGGTITFAGTSSVINAAGELIRIVNSAPTFSYAGTFQRTTGNATGILAQNNTGGTITFNGDGTTLDGDPADVTKSLSTGTANAVSLVNNGGTTFQFAGGMTLVATSGAAFNATGGGTVTLTGAGNTVNTTGGGTGVNVQNTSIGAGGVNLLSLNASGGGTNAIVLLNSGSGGFQVTGDGASDAGNTTRGRTTAKSGGGTVALASGGTITGKTGDAVSLSSTGAVTLRNLVVQNGGGDAIDATSVGGLTIDNTRVASNAAGFGLFAQTTTGVQVIHSEFVNNATNAGLESSDTWNLRWHNVTGTSSVESSVLQNAREHVWGVFNNTGTLTLTASNSNITGAAAGSGVVLDVAGSGNVSSSFQNDSVAGHSSTGILASTQVTTGAALSVTVNNSAFTDEFSGVAVAHGSSGATSFNITNNRFQRHGSVVININRLGADAFGFTNFGLFQGTVSGNTIGTVGVANSGSDAGDGIDVKTNGNGGITRVAVLNNTIREYGQHGIALLPRDASSGHTLEARVQGNTITNGEAVVSLDGINTTLGALNTDLVTVCLNVSGNTVSNAVRNGVRVRSSGLPAPNVTLRLHGWDGVTAPATYFANNNPSATGASGNVSFSNANGTNSSATCTTP